jgi:uncharacterized protein YndB with AHSA1/START domain
MTSDLATFDDRYTMRYVRVLPHRIERVWAAVTQAEQLNLWLMPVTEIEPRLGGRCLFSWGGPLAAAEEFSVMVFEPPRRVRYGNAGSAIEFLLEPEGAATRLTFLHLFASHERLQAMEGAAGGGLPAGPDTPWRPGFVAGFHVALDNLRRHLDAQLSPERIAALSAEHVARANAGDKTLFEGAGDAKAWQALVQAYGEVIREACPPGASARYDDERPK